MRFASLSKHNQSGREHPRVWNYSVVGPWIILTLADHSSHDQRFTTGTCVLHASPWKHAKWKWVEKHSAQSTVWRSPNQLKWKISKPNQTICWNLQMAWECTYQYDQALQSRFVCRQEIVMSVSEIIRLLKILHQDRMCVGYLSAHILPRRSSSFRIRRSSSLVPIQKYSSGSATSEGRWLWFLLSYRHANFEFFFLEFFWTDPPKERKKHRRPDHRMQPSLLFQH